VQKPTDLHLAEADVLPDPLLTPAVDEPQLQDRALAWVEVKHRT
jgi:hypothetical protein